MVHIFQRMFNRPARRHTSEELHSPEHVRNERTRRIAEEQAQREQKHRARSEELLRSFPPVQEGLGLKVGWERSILARMHTRLCIASKR